MWARVSISLWFCCIFLMTNEVEHLFFLYWSLGYPILWSVCQAFCLHFYWVVGVMKRVFFFLILWIFYLCQLHVLQIPSPCGLPFQTQWSFSDRWSFLILMWSSIFWWDCWWWKVSIFEKYYCLNIAPLSFSLPLTFIFWDYRYTYKRSFYHVLHVSYALSCLAIFFLILFHLYALAWHYFNLFSNVPFLSSPVSNLYLSPL